MELKYGLTRMTDSSAWTTPDPRYESVLSLQLTQPLLRGGGEHTRTGLFLDVAEEDRLLPRGELAEADVDRLRLAHDLCAAQMLMHGNGGQAAGLSPRSPYIRGMLPLPVPCGVYRRYLVLRRLPQRCHSRMSGLSGRGLLRMTRGESWGQPRKPDAIPVSRLRA